MKKKLTIGITVLFVVAAFGLLGTACSKVELDGQKSKAHTVTFDANGGTFSDGVLTVEKSVDHGGYVTIDDNPSRSDYFFFGWLSEADDSQAVDLSSTEISDNTTFYAGWRIAVDVTYYYNFEGAPSGGVYLSQKLPRSSLVSKPSAPTRGGYTFDCWTVDTEGYNEWIFSEDTAIKEVRLYAQWINDEVKPTIHTVTLHIVGDTETYAVADNTAFREPETPEINGYDFIEWRVGSIDGDRYDFSSLVSADIDLYAYFREELPTGEHRIHYVLDDGKSTVAENASTNPTTFTEGTAVNLASPTRACYTFEGWYKDEYFNTKITTVKDETDDVTLYAKWKYNYPFYITGDHISWSNYPTFEQLTEINTQKNECAFYPLVTGTGSSRAWDGKTYVAERVYLRASGDISSTGVKIIAYGASATNNTVWYGAKGKTSGDSNIAVSEAGYYTVTIKVLDASSLEVPVLALRKFTVSFVTGDVEFTVADRVVKDGELITEPLFKGHSVDKWYTDPQKTNVWNFRSDKVTSDVTLYEGNISVKVFGVVYAAYNHLAWKNAVTAVEYGGTLDLAYLLDDGYSKSDIGVTINNVKVSGTTIVVEYDGADVIVVGIHGNIVLNTYTVKFMYLGDELCNPITAKHGSTITPLAAPDAPQGHRFVGWYDSEKVLWEETMPITSDLELVPKYEPMLFTVTFDSKGGSDVPSLYDVVYGSSIDCPEEPNRQNYIFKGWYKDPECSDDQKWDFELDKVTDDITLYAKWELNASADKYTVTLLYEKGGSTYKAFDIAAGDAIEEQAPSRNGYIFDKWYEEESDSEFDIGTAINKNITLYATWKLEAPSVTLDGVSGQYRVDGYMLTAVSSHLADGVTYTYKWYKNGVVIIGAEQSTYAVVNVADSGEYTVEVFAHVGALVSESTPMTATVNISKAVLPFITSVAFKNDDAYSLTVVFSAENTDLATHYTVTVLDSGSSVVSTNELAVGVQKEILFTEELKGDYTVQISYKGLVSDNSNIDNVAATQPLRFKGNGSAQCPFAVENADDLKLVAGYATYRFEQTANIDATGISSLFTSDAPFKGVYDGKGNTVTDFTDARGLFGYIGTGATVKNIVMTKVNISGGKEIEFVGGIAAENYGAVTGITVGLLSDYSDKSKIDSNISSSFGEVEGDDVGTYAVGGIVGKNSGTVSDCVNNARIWGNKTVGGIVGCNEDGAIVKNCTNNALIGTATTTVSKSGFMSYAGGLVGKNVGNVSQSINNGSVTAYKATDGSGNSNNYYGGLVAQNESGGIVSECINTATVRTDYGAAGLVPRNYGIVEYCINTGTVNARYSASNGIIRGDGSLLYCVMTGTVSLSNSADPDSTGGSKSCSGSSGSTVKYCYYKSSSEAPSSQAKATGNAVYDVSSQSKIDAMLAVLGDKFAWDGKAVTLKFTLN